MYFLLYFIQLYLLNLPSVMAMSLVMLAFRPTQKSSTWLTSICLSWTSATSRFVSITAVTAYSLIESIFGIIGYMTKLFLQHHHHLHV